MNDDYLWDGTGEPDREIEQIENLLARYRYNGVAPEMPKPQARTFFWPRLAAAAAMILVAVAAFWFVTHRPAKEEIAVVQAPAAPDDNRQKQQTGQPDRATTAAPTSNQLAVNNRVSDNQKIRRKAAPRAGEEKLPVAPSTDNESYEAQGGDSSAVALIDFETARHIEHAQMLLRSFRNAEQTEEGRAIDVSYEKERSREILYKNILLRRDAEAKGNLPIEELLGSLEPILLDIANLPESPSKDDVRVIKDRMQKKEIVASLQVYSAPTVGVAFER
jgi:hypothetical protein